MDRYEWSRLNRLQVGKYAEYFVKMEFTLFGFDVYTSEVDDHGVDFVVRTRETGYYDVQVKSARVTSSSAYIFFPKDLFPLRSTLLAAIVLLYQHREPELYLIPAIAWTEPNELLRDRPYDGLKSRPEWGLNISQKNAPLLAPYAFNNAVQQL
jgi:hypothetical protein